MLNEMWVEHFNIIVLLVLLKMDINIFENESSQQQVRFIDRAEKIPRADRHYPILPPLPLSDLKSNNSPNNYAKLYARALLPSLPYFITIRIRWSRSWNFYNRIPGRKESQTSVHLEFNTEQIAKLERNYTQAPYTPCIHAVATHTHTHVRARPVRDYIYPLACLRVDFPLCKYQGEGHGLIRGMEGRGGSRQGLKRSNPLPVIDVTNFHKGSRHRPITSLTRPDKSRKIHRSQYRAELPFDSRPVDGDICARLPLLPARLIFFHFVQIGSNSFTREN